MSETKPAFDFDNITRASILEHRLPEGKINPYGLACALSETVDHCLVPPSVAEFERLLETDTDIVETLNEFYPDQPSGADKQYLGLDTQDREMISNIVAMMLTGRGWPTYGDGEKAFDEFTEKLKVGAIQRGWTFRDPEREAN